jgi:3-hydroxybutyryl-CoA dehydrogenase
MQIRNVTVCGSGVLGAQIAFQTAFHQFEVVVYDISNEQLEKLKTRFQQLSEAYQKDLNATQQALDAAVARISCSTDLSEATKDADLVIEAIPENVQIKKDFYMQLGNVAPAKTIFCSNSSTLLPSQFAQETGRPERFCALHFANNIRTRNTAEIMGHAGTDPKVFNSVVAFAKAIGMIALPIHKEQPGYILNSLLVPFINAGMELYVNGVAEPHTIDKTWMKATGAPRGPFGICDAIGMNTLYNVFKMAADKGGEQAQKVVQVLQEKFIDKGKLGVQTGEGFYTYPNPAYESANFLKQ